MRKTRSRFLALAVTIAAVLFCGACEDELPYQPQSTSNSQPSSMSVTDVSTATSAISSGTSSVPVVNHYTVTWNVDGALTTESYIEGEVPEYKNGTPSKPSDQQYSYTFNTWSPELSPVAENTTYTALFIKHLEKTKINFDLDGGTSEHDSSPIYRSNISSSDFFFDCKKEGWNFRGWSYYGVKVFDEKGNQLVSPQIVETMTFVAIYSQSVCLTIISNLEGAGTVIGEGEYPYNTYVDVCACPKRGYIFIGWYYEDTLLSNSEDYKYMMWSEDVTLEARFDYDSFKLNIHTNNENYGLVLLKNPMNNNYNSFYEEHRNYLTTTTIAAYSKTDVRFLGWYDSNNELVSTNAVYTFLMPNHDYFLEAKWNYFTVSYVLNGGINDELNVDHYTADDETVSLYKPQRAGYTFIGWKYENEFITKIEPSWIKNIELNAVWEACNYSINYVLNGGTNNESNINSYTIQDLSFTLLDPSRTGYTFNGWYTDSNFENEISIIESGTYGDITLYAKWSIVVYSIVYDLDGGENSENNPQEYTIETSVTFDSPTREGYTFIGWFDSCDNLVSSISPGTNGLISIKAKWSPLLHGLSVLSEDPSLGTVSINSGTGYTGETITVNATPLGDSIFCGWFNGATKVSFDENYTFTMPNESLSLTAHFIAKNEWDITHGVKPTLSVDKKTITYGLYPQQVVDDSFLESRLNALTSTDENGWYYLNGDYYAKRKASVYKYGGSYKFDNGSYIDEYRTYWFKCSPIVWDVLSDNNGELLLLSSVLLSYNRFDDNSPNVSNSELYQWLNGNFYNAAFMLDSTYIFSSSSSKIFLLSYSQYLNSSYGFSISKEASNTRYCKTTDWVRALGISMDNNESSATYKNASYFTSSYDSNDFMFTVKINGSIAGGRTDGSYGCHYYSCSGIRPAIRILI